MNETTYTFKAGSNGTECKKNAKWTTSSSSSTASVELPGASRNCYEFLGWYTSASGGDPV